MRLVGEPSRVALVTLGCKVNQAESEAIVADALGPGGATVDLAEADVVVVNTCTVTGEADHKARKAVRRALRLPREPVVVVTGCLAALDAGGLEALGPRVIVEADKARVPQRVRAAMPDRPVAARPAGGMRPARSRVAVKVQDGCDTFCAYCIVPHARGLPRSVPRDEIVAQVAELARRGVAEVVLTGINIGRYRDGSAGLPELVRAVGATGIPRVRLSSIEPPDVTPALLEAVAETDSFCPHLHIPLQSGCDRTLHAMGRPYDTRRFAAVVAAAREALHDVALTTDVIVGFPGETEVDAAASRDFVAAQGFSRLHVFRFSPRPGTPAAEMGPAVPPKAASARAEAMRALGERARSAFARSMAGTPDEILVERVTASADGTVVARGTTRRYLTAEIATERAAPGDRIAVVLGPEGPDGALRAVASASGHTW